MSPTPPTPTDAHSLARAHRAAAIEARLAAQVQTQSQSSSASASASASSSSLGSAPTPAEEQDLLKKLRRIVDLQIMRDNTYDKAQECMETLEKILNNILSNPTDPKYRTLRATNPRLKRSVLLVPGGSDYLLHSGFGVRTVEFQEEWHCAATTDRKVRLAVEVLRARLGEARERSEAAKRYKEREEREEKGRVGRVLQEAEEDRERVRRRVERERAIREREAQQRQGHEREQEHEQAGSLVTPGDYVAQAEVPFDAPSHRGEGEGQGADQQGERPPPYGEEHWGTGRLLRD